MKLILAKKNDSRINKKLEVKFEIRRGTYISHYKAQAGNDNHFRKVNDIKDFDKTTNPIYVHKRQHVFHNDKEISDNCVLDDDIFF